MATLSRAPVRGAVRFAMDRAGLVGADGATHCGAFDITYMATVSRLTPQHPRDSRGPGI